MESEQHFWGYVVSNIIFLADLTIRIGLSTRVILRKRPYGVTLAWLVVILLVPFLGAIFYLFFGENRISEKRAERASRSLQHYQTWLQSLQDRSPVDWSKINPECEPINRQASNLIGIPALAHNDLELICSPEEIMRSILADIEKSNSTCHLQFYIWYDGGTADEIALALIRAAQRGVTCRILVDAIGSRDFLRGKQAAQLRAAGVRVIESLSAGIFKALFARIDIRNHRKIVVIDGSIAYTGSQNMVDPLHFKQSEGVGQWVDMMVRIRGPVVESLAGTFINDWFLETEADRSEMRSLNQDIAYVRKIADIHPSDKAGDIAVQLVPSGPGLVPDAIHHLLLATIYAARKELILTTPYFVPDESLLTALKSAAERGVDVQIILPKKNDSKLVHFASQAHFEDLIQAGVNIFLFTGGLLHSKTITVDQDYALFGSVNLDMRSFWLNFEATLFIYNSDFTAKIRSEQKMYQRTSQHLALADLSDRPVTVKFKENVALLIGPLL
jgi:cardiolipin synthase